MKKQKKAKKEDKKSVDPSPDAPKYEMIVWKQLPHDDPIYDLKDKQIEAAKVLAALQYSKGDKVYTGAVDAAAMRADVSCYAVYDWLKNIHFLRYIDMLKAARAAVCRQNLWNLGEFEGSVAANIYELKIHNTAKFNDQFLAEKETLELKIKLAELENQSAALKIPQVILRFDESEPAIPEELKPYLKIVQEVH